MRGKKTARRARKHTSRAIVRHESGSSMVERQQAATGGVTALEVIALILTARSAHALTASTWHLRVWTGTWQRTRLLCVEPVVELCGLWRRHNCYKLLSVHSNRRMPERCAERVSASFQQRSSPTPASLAPLRHHDAARKGRGGRIVGARQRLLLQADGLQGRDSDFRRRQMHVGAVR